ncbi:MAG: flagellar basal body-associated FliL family protein [Sedimentisphaerales bacterium]|nr:flagellar basal body-associated FliL family protein [Sedimentisphaerales bacterium]
MADEEKTQAEQKKEGKSDTVENTKGGGLLQWIIPGVILIFMMTFGFFLGSFLGKSPKEAQAQQQTENADEQQITEQLFTKETSKENKDGWFYVLDPIATNLKDPGSTRYVRAALTLEMVPQADEAKTREYLDKKKPIISNILNIYFAGLSIDDLNSDKNLRRIQYELINILNETLCPNTKPLVKQILFQEFGVQ